MPLWKGEKDKSNVSSCVIFSILSLLLKHFNNGSIMERKSGFLLNMG